MEAYESVESAKKVHGHYDRIEQEHQTLSTLVEESERRHAEELATLRAAASRPTALVEKLQKQVYEAALNNIRAARTNVDNTRRSIDWESERANRYLVEIYKKYSIAVACIIFALIGIPLGLSMKRGGLGAMGATALGIFLFYWVTLVQGEKLADRGKLEPWIGMWGANIVMLIIAALLIAYVLLDLRARAFFTPKPTPPDPSAATSESA